MITHDLARGPAQALIGSLNKERTRRTHIPTSLAKKEGELENVDG